MHLGFSLRLSAFPMHLNYALLGRPPTVLNPIGFYWVRACVVGSG